MKYQGLVLDIDGTLIRNNNNLIYDQDLLAITSLITAGVPVVLATGRPQHSTIPVAEHLGIVSPLITFFGALTFSTESDSEYLEIPILPQNVEKLTTWAQENSLSIYMSTRQGTIVFGNISDEFQFLNPIEQANRAPLDFADNTLQIVLPISTDALRNSFFDLFEAGYFNQFQINGRRRYMTFLAAKVSKGFALRQLAAKQHWNLRDFVAIGNDIMDVPMFKEVGLSIAVENPRYPEISSLADVTISGESTNLIARSVEKYF